MNFHSLRAPILWTCLVLLGAVADHRGAQSADPPAAKQPGKKQPAAKEPAAKPATKQPPVTKAVPTKPAAKPAAKKEERRNRLAKETSPYLLQHAHNPVDWRPWGDEALEAAKREKKPIFLSIGYSSCHWCHVMERESFVDEEIAAVLNKNFICIKVDREERPDVDHVYMTSLQVFQQLTRGTRGGGWPLSMFLTPEGEPFFGGTYFPAKDGDRGQPTGFLTLLQRIAEVWAKDPDKIGQDAKTITRFVKLELEQQRPALATKLDQKLVDGVQSALNEQFDPQFGGFGYSETDSRRPKFPEPPNLHYLLDRIERLRAAKQDAAEPLKQLDLTLRRMAQGGIRDHVGGGFHRYSVDRQWQIPHFEKMLYDNAQLAPVYAAAYQLTKRDEFRRVAVEAVEFVLREMTDKKGGFYAALDADSEDEEGKFYRWDLVEVKKVLSAEEFQLFAAVYGLDGEPNFEEHFHVPQLAKPLADIATARKTAEVELDKRLAPLREKLLTVRNRRPRPLTDTKVLTSWNGLAIRGLADCGRILKEPRYIEAATRAADFLLAEVRTKDGRLLRTYSQDQAKLNAYLPDYAMVVDGLIGLHEATGDAKWLEAADALTARQIELFWDERHGGFFFTSGDHESLLARSKVFVDGVEPSGNSVSASNLVYLGHKLKRPEYLDRAEKTIRAGGSLLENSPSATPRLAVALAAMLDAPKDP